MDGREADARPRDPGPPRESAGAPFLLAGRRIEPELNRIVAGGATIQVEPKVMGVLLLLAERPGEVVSKEELLARVWAGVHVSDDVVFRSVRALRRILEDGSDGAGTPGVIETIRKRGYRLSAPVERAGTPRAPRAEPSPPRPRLRAARIAALAAALASIGALAWVARVERGGGPAPRPRFRPATSLPGSEHDPAFSPDGARLAFAWDGGRAGPTSLYVKALDSEAIERLTAGPGSDRSPQWSPDGSRIAFVRRSGEGCEILQISAFGGSEHLVTPCPDPRHPRFSWTPDGRWLATAAGPPGAAGIELVALDSGERRRIGVELAPGASAVKPVLSPDGGSVAFIAWLGDLVGDLYILPVEDGPAGGGPARRLTFDGADIMGHAWSDGGRSLVVSSNRAGMHSLWRIPADGGEPELLAGGGRKIKHPTSTLTGSHIAYEAWDLEVSLWRLPLGFAAAGEPPAGAAVAAASDEWSFEPRLSPDGSRLAFASTRSGSYEIWVSGADGSDPRRLTSFGGPYVGKPRWSPDGTRLAFVARPSPAGRADVYAASVAGGPPQRLTSHALDELAPSWSADGAWGYFGSRHEGEWQVYRRRLATGEEERVTADGGLAAVESPDGRWLYFSRLDRPGLWRRPAGGGAEVLVAAEVQPEEGGNWGVTQAGVYWLVPGDTEAPALALLRHGESEAREVARLPDFGWAGIEVSADGRHLYYARMTRAESNLVLLTRTPPG